MEIEAGAVCLLRSIEEEIDSVKMTLNSLQSKLISLKQERDRLKARIISEPENQLYFYGDLVYYTFKDGGEYYGRIRTAYANDDGKIFYDVAKLGKGGVMTDQNCLTRVRQTRLKSGAPIMREIQND